MNYTHGRFTALLVTALVVLFSTVGGALYAATQQVASAQEPVCDPRYTDWKDVDGMWCIVAQPPVMAWLEYAAYFAAPDRPCSPEWDTTKDEVGLEWCVLEDWSEEIQ